MSILLATNEPEWTKTPTTENSRKFEQFEKEIRETLRGKKTGSAMAPGGWNDPQEDYYSR